MGVGVASLVDPGVDPDGPVTVSKPVVAAVPGIVDTGAVGVVTDVSAGSGPVSGSAVMVGVVPPGKAVGALWPEVTAGPAAVSSSRSSA